MKILSLNIGKSVQLNWQNETVETGIFKNSTTQPCKVSFAGIDGDEQADLVHHGGVDKAVYAYDTAYYQHWQTILPQYNWQPAMLGENLTTQGLTDNLVLIGNQYKIGSAIVMAVQPRFPCFKLNIKTGIPNMLELFVQQQKHGIYFKVLQEGTIQVNDTIELLQASKHNVSILQLVQAYYSKGVNKTLLQEILQIEVLPQKLRQTFESFMKR
jgi:MOSC domain-containing protein YiiM